MGGYFKVWRKIEDSKSWSRGALYRGLMITLLQKANWKQGYFHGQDFLPVKVSLLPRAGNPAGPACLFRGFAGERA